MIQETLKLIVVGRIDLFAFNAQFTHNFADFTLRVLSGVTALFVYLRSVATHNVKTEHNVKRHITK